MKEISMSDADPEADSAPREPWLACMQRILVVDRDDSSVASARQFFAPHPCTIVWAKDDSEALAMIDEVRLARCHDVILADLRLCLNPESAYFTLIQAGGMHLPIILTYPLGYDCGATIAKARRMGVRVFLYTPFRAEQFSDALSQVICKVRM